MNRTEKNIKNVMTLLNISSKQDLDVLVDGLTSLLKDKSLVNNTEQEDRLQFTDARKPPTEREKDLYNINALATHYEYIHTIWRNQLYPSLKAIDSPLASKLHDRFTDGTVFLSYIKKAAKKRLLPGEESRID